MDREWTGGWIWPELDTGERNAWARFRRTFVYTGGAVQLNITADSRYLLWVNGEYVGEGPVRGWPWRWRYDTYDITPWMTDGQNVIAVNVQHYGNGSFHYLHRPQGLLAELQLGDVRLGTDPLWVAEPDPCYAVDAPRMAVQQPYEEQYDARLDDGWRTAGYDDSRWHPARVLRPAEDGVHTNLSARDIPFLTMEPRLPVRVESMEQVRARGQHWTIDYKRYVLPDDRESNGIMAHVYLATRAWVPNDCEARFLVSHYHPRAAKINGDAVTEGVWKLRAGWNDVVLNQHTLTHLLHTVVSVECTEPITLRCTGQPNDPEWAVVGPFALTDAEMDAVKDVFHAQVFAPPVCPEATASEGEAFWESGCLAFAQDAPWLRFIEKPYVTSNDVFVQAVADVPTGAAAQIDHPEALLGADDWSVVYPGAPNTDIRILLDYGQEILALQRFEVEAPEGVQIDLHNFEFMAPNGRCDLAEGMNNSFRYTTRAGRQVFQNTWRHGFRYSQLIIRGLKEPIRLRGVMALENTYPQTRRGRFACSDAQLDRIWQVGAQTLRCCAEDTYTDCPTYERTHWVGDARNEALVDYTINGDPRLWFHCLEQAGDSLERSPITESHVPSSWVNVIPAWSFLWMKSCREYYWHTGDVEGAQRLLGFLSRNIQGVRDHLDERGLFSIRAWNMFDWAAMDTPGHGVVTHQNCFAVGALRDAAWLADQLNRADLSSDWNQLADSIRASIDAYLWSDTEQAYTDCLRGDVHSPVFSQQTQTAALMCGVASGDRERRCIDILYNPPPHFVKAGSPFFEFFLLEALQNDRQDTRFLDIIRKDWGFMVDLGATTFWEMWTVGDAEQNAGGEHGRITRSYCHGWSAAPTYFLCSWVLGVRPGAPGFRTVVIDPHPGDLRWARGVVPTPQGDIHIRWEAQEGTLHRLLVNAPSEVMLDVSPLPEGCTYTEQRR